MITRTHAVLSFVVLALIVAVSFGVHTLSAQTPEAHAKVHTVLVGTGTVADEYTTVATIEAHREVAVAPKLPGSITAVYAAVGARVHAGETLATLDDATTASALHGITSQLNALEQTTTAVKDLYTDKERAADAQQEAFTNTAPTAPSKVRSALTESAMAVEQANDFLSTVLSVRNGVENEEASYNRYLAARDSAKKLQAVQSLQQLQHLYPSYKTYFNEHILSGTPSESEVAEATRQATEILTASKSALNDTYAVLVNTVAVPDLPEQQLTSFKTTTTSIGAAVERAQQDVQDVQLAATQAAIARSSATKEKDAKTAELALQRAQLTTQETASQIALNDTYVTAPFDGVITEKIAEEGMVVSPGAPLFRLIDTSSYKLMVTLPDSLGAHASDLAFTITTDAGVVIPAQIDIVHPTVDPISKKVVVELRVNATDTMLPVGSSVTVVARVPHNDLLVVPASAVIARYGKNIVFTVTPDNIVHERDVQIGAHTELTVAITDGIHDGDRVVTDGYRYLRDGDTVTTE